MCIPIFPNKQDDYMAGNNLLSLIENIQTWDKLEKRIVDLPTEIQRGNARIKYSERL
jgi:hypothetical protein